ncbi:cell division protein ZapD [Aliagarivorans taiwanensis]|uniref:cell division protein ZapD n=1 Tax=Aliagarivorans taiwanensis TaxID=561966 RepID=UPI000417C1E6|nr:cell division protein ZapD [Aliagarivorans taiwanensis]
MGTLTYEHPLNEKTRNYLRLEHLFNSLLKASSLQDDMHQQVFFKVLFDLAEVLERCDWRSDLLKDFTKYGQQLQRWAEQPGVDTSKIEQLQAELTALSQQIHKIARINDHLKEDRLLNSVRQRINLPGGHCDFDLPQLHWWLSQPQQTFMSSVEGWIAPYQPLLQAINQIMLIIRQQSHSSDVIAAGGFYQGVAENCCLLRIEVPDEVAAYPTVSGHKHRFAIKFLPTNHQEPGDIPCRLYCCKISE